MIWFRSEILFDYQKPSYHIHFQIGYNRPGKSSESKYIYITNSHKYALGESWPPTTENIVEPSHGRVFCEKFRSVRMVKGVRILLTELFSSKHIHIRDIDIPDWICCLSKSFSCSNSRVSDSRSSDRDLICSTYASISCTSAACWLLADSYFSSKLLNSS